MHANKNLFTYQPTFRLCQSGPITTLMQLMLVPEIKTEMELGKQVVATPHQVIYYLLDALKMKAKVFLYNICSINISYVDLDVRQTHWGM
jgi:hypothetical protein